MNTALAIKHENAGLETGLSIFDQGTFANLYRVAEMIATSSLVPETLRGETFEQTTANCLRVVEQSSRWKMSPFAVIDCASVVYGRLMWEGKLIAAVVDAALGIRLDFEYSGTGMDRKVVVIGKFADETKPRTIEGTVSQWRTTGKGSPWDNPNNHDRQLAYRGSREWARRHAPGVVLGVYTPDEFEPPMRDVTPRVEPTTTKVITGGTATPEPTIEKPAPAKASKGKAAPAKAQQAESQPIPERGVMVDAIRTAFTEAGLFASGAQKVCRDAKLLDENVAFSDISDEQMAQVYHRRLELFPPLPIIAAFYDRHTVTKSPEGAERKWTRWSVIYQVAGEKGDHEASTFSATFGAILDSLQGGEALLLRVAAGEKGGQITHLELPTEGGTEA